MDARGRRRAGRFAAVRGQRGPGGRTEDVDDDLRFGFAPAARGPLLGGDRFKLARDAGIGAAGRHATSAPVDRLFQIGRG